MDTEPERARESPDDAQRAKAVAAIDTTRPAVSPERARRFARLTRRATMLRYARGNIVPTLRVELTVDFERVFAWLPALNADRTRPRRVTLNHVTMKAVAAALRNHIYFNYAFDGGWRLHPVEQIDLRTPVDLGDFPQHVVIPRTDTRSIGEIADLFYTGRDAMTGNVQTPIEDRLAFFALPWALLEAMAAAGSALRALRCFFPGWQAASLAEQRSWFGSYMVTNGGTVGAEGAAGLIVRPSIAATGFLAVYPQALVRDGQVVVRRAGKVTCGFDHRFIDAAQATRFLLEVRRNLEDPERHLAGGQPPPMFPGSIGGVLP